MPARKKSEPANEGNDLSFEAALAKLEGIVDAMEGEELPLEDLVSQYETGSSLLKHCDAILTSARKRVELITLPNGRASDTRLSSGETQQAPDDDNDITLF